MYVLQVTVKVRLTLFQDYLQTVVMATIWLYLGQVLANCLPTYMDYMDYMDPRGFTGGRAIAY
jgi:hypothetical protein